MNNKWSIDDFLYCIFFLVCLVLIIIGFIFNGKMIASSLFVSGVFGFLAFAYLHKYIERKIYAYFISISLMTFAGVSLFLENKTLMVGTTIGTLVLCAVVWFIDKVKND